MTIIQSKPMTKFKFNPKTGTMERQEQQEPKATPSSQSKEQQVASLIKTFQEQKAKEPPKPGILDDKEEPIKAFKAFSQLDTFQILDQRNENIMAVISGYDLDINFNLTLLDSTEKVEQLVNGIAALFRQILMEKLLGGE